MSYSKKNSHILCIGCTGMLRGAVLHLAQNKSIITITGRNRNRLYSLQREAEFARGRINPIQADYSNPELFISLLKTQVNNFGEFSLAVLWVHSSSGNLPYLIAENILNECSTVIDILSSSYSINESKLEARKKEMSKYIKNYKQVILGCKYENGSKRWLTDEEISSGVIYALYKDFEYFMIGEKP